MYAYVGSRTSRERHARGEGISVFRVDPGSGRLDLVQVVGGLVNPSFLALNRRGDRLYTVHGDEHEVSAFGVNPVDGRLIFLNQQSCQGKNPVHLALDPTERHLVVSNHLTGELAVLPVAADGSLGAVTQRVRLEGQPGPHRVEQPFSKPHFNGFDPSGRFVLVPDKGLDRIFCFHLEEGRLRPTAQASVATREGAGPRHTAFHPCGEWVYAVNELDATVTAYRFDTADGTLTPFQCLPSVPDSCIGNSRGAEIEVSADGRTLYASNRGHDSIAVFRIAPDSGRLAFEQAQDSGGRTPRFFAPDPTGRWLFALNEDSDSIVTLAVDPHSGHLAPTGSAMACGSPVCMVFSRA